MIAGALTTAILTGLSLIGSPIPAHAEDGTTCFRTEQEVFDFISRSAPLNHKEAVKGYPISGQELQEVKAQFPYKTGATVGQEASETSGWSVGGRGSGKLGVGGEPSPEINFAYSESTTTTNKWTPMTEQNNTCASPTASRAGSKYAPTAARISGTSSTRSTSPTPAATESRGWSSSRPVS